MKFVYRIRMRFNTSRIPGYYARLPNAILLVSKMRFARLATIRGETMPPS